MATIFLTSTGLSSAPVHQAFEKEVRGNQDQHKVFIVTTAAKDGVKNQYVRKAYQQLKSMGFTHVRYFDVLTDDIEELKQATIIYMCGGNTFYLQKALRDTGSDQVIIDFCELGEGIYIGVSAGSIILGTSIASAASAETEEDKNRPRLTKLRSMAVVPYVVMVHYSPKDAQRLAKLQQDFPEVRTISDEQAIIRRGEEEEFI